MLRDSFGQLRPNLRTVGESGEGGTPAADAGTPAPDAGTPAADAAATPAAPAAGTAAQDVASLPDWAQKLVRDTRAEAANYRTKATTAATDAEKAFADKIAIAAGLKTDAAADPGALAQQLSAAQQAQKDTAIQLAVHRAATGLQGNPDALLDSNTFLASVKALDPSAAEFPTQVTDAIKAALTSNSSLRLVQATGSSAADHAGSTGETGAITEQQLASMTPEQINKAHREGRLQHLLA